MGQVVEYDNPEKRERQCAIPFYLSSPTLHKKPAPVFLRGGRECPTPLYCAHFASGMIASFRSPMPGGITTFLSVCLPLLLGR
jgi:hypothetical protein